MNRNETLLKAIIICLFIASCGAAGSNKLSINATNMAFLIAYGNDLQFPDGDACYSGQTISRPSFTISKIKTTWKGEGKVRPQLLKVDVNATGNSQKYTCVFTAASGVDSIAFALGFGAVNDIEKLPADDEIAEDSYCSFICGAFSITNKNASLSAGGQIKLYGVHTKTLDNGEEVEVQISASDSFNLQYSP
jgi:hypothetical protein